MPAPDTLTGSARAEVSEPDPVLETTSSDLIYFSSASGNTPRFIERLGRPAARIPLFSKRERLRATRPFVLVLPTYGGGGLGGAVPKQVIAFLNDPANRALLRGVIAAGNTNFGDAYCLAGDIVARKTGAPVLYRFEIFGTQDDLEAVRNGLDTLWKQP
jgi:protein involved in ribonucleotide reduction